MRLVYGFGIAAGVITGATLALLSMQNVEAAAERVDTHWHAGVWEWTNTAWWCFGASGWHSDQLSGTDRAADVFADASEPACYADNFTPRELRLHVSGYRPGGSQVAAIGVALVTQRPPSGACKAWRAAATGIFTRTWMGRSGT